MTSRIRARKKKVNTSAPDFDDCLVPDPDWVDLEALPPPDFHVMFHPPRRYQDELLADHDSWAAGAAKETYKAIASALATLVQPRLVDLYQWKVHATDFFKRLCSHRKYVHAQSIAALDQLQDRLSVIEMRMHAMESSIEHIRITHTSIERKSGGNVHARLGVEPEAKKTASRARSTFDPKMIMHAQLDAVRARSSSPGPDALKVLADHGSRFGYDTLVIPSRLHDAHDRSH